MQHFPFCYLFLHSIPVELMGSIHPRRHRLLQYIASKIREQGYWWPGMLRDIDKQIHSCQACLRFNIEKEGYHPAKSIMANEPWDHIQIDLIGPLPSSESGFCHILTVIDVCTGYTVVRAVKNKEMETIARLMWGIFCEYGTPRILQSDNGTEFANQVNQSICIWMIGCAKPMIYSIYYCQCFHDLIGKFSAII